MTVASVECGADPSVGDNVCAVDAKPEKWSKAFRAEITRESQMSDTELQNLKLRLPSLVLL